MAKPTGAQVVAQALQYAQEKRSYQEMDCQAMIEAAVRACGGKMDYTGSNAMARAVTGLMPLSEAKKAGLQVGMALFIHEDGGSYPAKYHADGRGNFSHVGLYAGENALTDVDKKGRERACNVVHSSASMGRVAGSTLANGWTHAGQPTQDTRIPDSVIRVMRHKGKIGEGIDHPAVFPVALPKFVIEAFTAEGDVVFEPFGGSGSTMLAAQRTGRVCRSVEIAPEYVDVAIRRFRQNHPEVAITLLATGHSFDDVAAEREVEVAT